MNGYILQRINDLRNYLAHIDLFPAQLPDDIDPQREKQRVQRLMDALACELTLAR